MEFKVKYYLPQYVDIQHIIQEQITNLKSEMETKRGLQYIT